MERLSSQVKLEQGLEPVSVLNGLESVYGYFDKENSQIDLGFTDPIVTSMKRLT